MFLHLHLLYLLHVAPEVPNNIPRNPTFVVSLHLKLSILVKKYKIVSFASSRMKNIVLFPAESKFLVKLIRCIAFGLTLGAYVLLKYVAIDFYFSLKYG